jgi:ABC-type polar amino acid transport system ATPase subunit
MTVPALALGSPLLLMDERASALDPERRGSLGQLLRQLCERGETVRMATHDL